MGPQEAFLSSPADLAIYGGAAGGGKSWALLMEPLRHIANPAFGAVIFRRTSPQITREGGLWDTSTHLYPRLAAAPNLSEHLWTFPSGARITFAHLVHESTIFNWQGSQIAFLGFDELTHFTERQFFYMLTRNRSTCGVRPYVRGGCNPDPDSWVAGFIAWWLDGDTGLPIPERAGRLRWFIRVEEQLLWADTPAELVARYPQSAPKSVTFIPARLTDNQILMQADPGYLANLLAQPLVDRERLLGGNWKIRPTAGKVFNRAWFDIVDSVPAGGDEVRFWDLAATAKAFAKDDPDYTAGVLLRRVGGVYYVLDVVAIQEGPAEVDQQMKALADQDAARARATGTRYRVRWEQEGGASGPRDSLRLVQLLAPHDAGAVRPEGDKLTRAKGLAAQALARNVKLLRGAWNELWLQHMHGQPDLPHDDIMDGSSGAFNELAEPSDVTPVDADVQAALAAYRG